MHECSLLCAEFKLKHSKLQPRKWVLTPLLHCQHELYIMSQSFEVSLMKISHWSQWFVRGGGMMPVPAYPEGRASCHLAVAQFRTALGLAGCHLHLTLYLWNFSIFCKLWTVWRLHQASFKGQPTGGFVLCWFLNCPICFVSLCDFCEWVDGNVMERKAAVAARSRTESFPRHK